MSIVYKMKTYLKSRKAELTTTQLVVLIVLIVSFIIILFLIFRLNPGEQSNKEICRNSVILKSRTAGVAGSLDCKTNYLCVSGNGDCEGFTASAKSEIILTEGKAEENKKQVMKALANEMSDCWYMLGEGKLPYEGGFASDTVHCAICSIVEFDGKIQKASPKITYSEFYDYLAKTQKEGSDSYLRYLYNTNDPTKIADGAYFGFDLNKEIDTSQRYSIITGVDMNPKLLFIGNDDKYLSTFIVPTSETPSTKCNEFITKA